MLVDMKSGRNVVLDLPELGKPLLWYFQQEKPITLTRDEDSQMPENSVSTMTELVKGLKDYGEIRSKLENQQSFNKPQTFLKIRLRSEITE